jgi:hypothetical protein
VLAVSGSKDLNKAVLTLVQEQLATLGFRKRKQQILSLPVSEDVVGFIGLNIATGGRGPGVLEINPVVGVRNQRVERLVAELVGEPFNELNPFSVGANVGYLSPESKYKPFIFTDAAAIQGPAGQLVGAVRMYGLPFINANAPLPAILETMRTRGFAIDYVAAYRIPVALHLLGKRAEADAFVSDELAKLGARTDPAAQRFRAFAGRFQERNHAAAGRNGKGGNDGLGAERGLG